jgi:hypothetical protein
LFWFDNERDNPVLFSALAEFNLDVVKAYDFVWLDACLALQVRADDQFSNVFEDGASNFLALPRGRDAYLFFGVVVEHVINEKLVGLVQSLFIRFVVLKLS